MERPPVLTPLDGCRKQASDGSFTRSTTEDKKGGGAYLAASERSHLDAENKKRAVIFLFCLNAKRFMVVPS